MSLSNVSGNLVQSEEVFKKLFSVDAYDFLQSNEKPANVTRIVFIRHAQAAHNKNKVMAGRTVDTQLSPEGMEQAKKAGEALKQTGFLAKLSAAYRSNMKRTEQTRERILNEYKLPDETDERLHERHYGAYEGATEAKYAPIKDLDEVKNSGSHKSFIEKFQYSPTPGMESMLEVYERVTSFMSAKHVQHKNSHLLVVTHNAGMKALVMMNAFRKGFDLEYRSFDLGNCSVVVVDADDKGFEVVATRGLAFRTNYKPILAPRSKL